MTSFFWSTLLLIATGATARKEFIYDVINPGLRPFYVWQIMGKLCRSET